MSNIYENLQKNLKDLRLESGLKQKDVADYLQVSRVSYNRYENGTRIIPLDLLLKIAKFYDVDINYFLEK